MKLLEQLRMLERLDQLIRMKATGTPKQLARRLDISERQVYRLIHEMKESGFPIDYCKERQSYYYSGKGKLLFELILEEQTCLRVKGGKKMEGFSQLTNFGSRKTYV